MKAWITTWALSSGIVEVEAEVAKTCAGMIIYGEGVSQRYIHGEGKNWHRTREKAVEAAEVMKLKKISSLRKQISKLGKLTFT